MSLQIEKSIVKKRMGAFLIDFFILALIQSIILFTVMIYKKALPFQNLILANIIATSINFFLYLIKDLPKGMSIGKKIMKIAVRNFEEHQKVPHFFRLVLRNIFVLIWPIDCIILLIDKKGRRIGDKIAKTEVVSLLFLVK